MTPIDPTTLLTVELQAQEINFIMMGLNELQRNLGSVMNKVMAQAQAQRPSGGGNGVDVEQRVSRGAQTVHADE